MTTTEMVMACCAASGPVTGALAWFGEKRTRRIVREEFGTLIDVALAKFKGDLNSPTGYRRSESCDLMMKPLESAVSKMSNEVHQIRMDVPHRRGHGNAAFGEGA